MSTCFHLKCNSSWQGNSRDREHQGFLQPAGERWMIISFLKCRSVIKWHRLTHFNQKKWAGELVDFMLGVLWRLLTHISPNSCLWQIPPCGLEITFPLKLLAVFLILRITPEFWDICLFVQWISLNLCAHPCWLFLPSLCFLCCSWHYLNGWV